MVDMEPRTKAPRLQRLGHATEYVYGVNDEAGRSRLARMADRGELRVVRIGQRGDRWFATSELDRLLGLEQDD